QCAVPFLSVAPTAGLYAEYYFKYDRNALHSLENGGCAAVDDVEIIGTLITAYYSSFAKRLLRVATTNHDLQD
ncbi:hypothetical protein QUF75_17910, partial [Desulfococcaceae bacterium HSG7]|nr:hypothetical protein [Desulfococcaceae bacterium HSG7]